MTPDRSERLEPGDTDLSRSPAVDADESSRGEADPLREYRQKRDFTQTAEPEGGAIAPDSDRAFFCVQKHAASSLHYDLRLEAGGVLKSWAVPKGPSPDPAEKRLAVRVEDHPLEYGTFEGTIPEGEYGAGTVLLWDRGWWELDTGRMKDPDVDPEAALSQGELKVVFHGEKLRGSWTLVQMKGRGAKNWLLIKHKDEEAHRGLDLTAEAPLSVASGRTMEEIAEDDASAGEATPVGGAPQGVAGDDTPPEPRDESGPVEPGGG